MDKITIERGALAALTRVPEQEMPITKEPRAKTPEETAIETAEDETPAEPEYRPSQGASLLQDLVQRIDLRAAVRVEQLADLRRCEVATENADREKKKILDGELEDAHRDFVSLTMRLQKTYDEDVRARKEGIEERRRLIAGLDKSLEQMRKQVVAEVAKLAPERKGE